ncbi:MAG: SIS domain-containing protein [Acetobacteraceae bacterium]
MTEPVPAYIPAYLARSLTALDALAGDRAAHATLGAMADAIAGAMRAGGKLLVAGNGGSAGDSQHIAGEFISRLLFDHAPLAAMALTVDGSVLTATGNDYGYEYVFERQVRGLGRPGDVLLAISTSGRSRNVLRALDAAREKGLICLGFTGAVPDKALMAERCAHLFSAPSTETAIIQQLHITAAHIVCALVEQAIFPELVPPG